MGLSVKLHGPARPEDLVSIVKMGRLHFVVLIHIKVQSPWVRNRLPEVTYLGVLMMIHEWFEDVLVGMTDTPLFEEPRIVHMEIVRIRESILHSTNSMSHLLLILIHV
jgi:hypothetical protein